MNNNYKKLYSTYMIFYILNILIILINVKCSSTPTFTTHTIFTGSADSIAKLEIFSDHSYAYAYKETTGGKIKVGLFNADGSEKSISPKPMNAVKSYSYPRTCKVNDDSILVLAMNLGANPRSADL